MRTRTLILLALSVTFLSLSACGPSEAELSATVTRVAAELSGTQTAEAPTPTDTPAPTDTPRPTETPTSTPTRMPPDPRPILRGAENNLLRYGLHMRAEANIDLSTEGLNVQMPMTVEGDFQPPDKARMLISMDRFGQTTEMELIAFGDELYTRDLALGEWTSAAGEGLPPFAINSLLSIASNDELETLDYVGLETLNGEKVYHLLGVAPAEILGEELDGELIYNFWIDVNFLLKKKTLEVEAIGPGEMFGLPGFAEVSLEITQDTEYSDYGQETTIERPEVKVVAEEPAGYVLGDVLLSEDFSRADSWERYKDSISGSSVEAAGGVYRLHSRAGGFWWGLNEQEHTDVVIEATGNNLSEEDIAYGLLCRARTINDGSGYWFLIDANGNAVIVSVGSEEYEVLADDTSSAIDLGSADNVIRAVCVRDYLALYVNDEFVVDARDSSYASGYAGLGALSDFDVVIDAAFDDLIIWEATAPSGDFVPLMADYDCPDAIGCVSIARGEPIRIATMQVLSGANSDLGEDQNRGVELAIDARNGELLGHPIELLREDAHCSAEGGAGAATRIVSDTEVVAIIGTSCSGAAVPASELMSDAGLAMISGSNTSPALTSIGGVAGPAWQPGYFRTAHNDIMLGQTAAEFAFLELGKRKAASIHGGDPYTEGLAATFNRAFVELGGEIVLTAAVNKGETYLSPVLTSVINEGAELLFFPIFEPEGALIVHQSKEIEGFEAVALMTADRLLSRSFVGSILHDGTGLYFAGPLTPTGRAYSDLVDSYEASYGEPPIHSFHGHAYDAADILLNAIEQIAVETEDGALHIGRQDLRDALYGFSDYQGITGSITCDEFGDCADPRVSIMQLLDPAAGLAGLRENIIYTVDIGE